jgi:hypothetical protein
MGQVESLPDVTQFLPPMGSSSSEFCAPTGCDKMRQSSANIMSEICETTKA